MQQTVTRSGEGILQDLNDAQRAAAQVCSGPLVILAGAGTGKTRVISRRAAHAIETKVVPAGKVLLVTFTDKAAHEMVERMAALGHPQVMARTFHSHAVRQLRHFWPSRHDGDEPPPRPRLQAAADQPARPRPARPLPLHAQQGHRRRHRVGQGPPHSPAKWESEPQATDRAPIPADLFARLYADYEHAKNKAKRSTSRTCSR